MGSQRSFGFRLFVLLLTNIGIGLVGFHFLHFLGKVVECMIQLVYLHSSPYSDLVDCTCFNTMGHVLHLLHRLVRVWDVGMGKCLKIIFGEESSDGVTMGCVKFSPTGTFLSNGSLADSVSCQNF